MSFDGVFIHYLVEELQLVTGNKINKVVAISTTDFIITLARKKRMLISMDSNHPHIRFTEADTGASNTSFPFFNTLKRLFENSIITKIYQYNCDRVVIIDVTHHDELGFSSNYKLICELMGRNSNLIIVDENNLIVDCFKKTYNLIDAKRVMINKINYTYPSSNKDNPFEHLDSSFTTNHFEGVSKILFEEITYQGSLEIINSPVKPTLITTDDKLYFYCFDLIHLIGERQYFSTLSELLEHYYSLVKGSNLKTAEQKTLEHFLKREINKLTQKHLKLVEELSYAKDNLKYEQIGNILSASLHLVKANSSSVTVNDFYTDKTITIELDPLLSPTENLNVIYAKYKKAKRAIPYLEEQIAHVLSDIEYNKSIYEQLNFNKNLDLREIIFELHIDKDSRHQHPQNRKPNITTYHDIYGGTILVGKNNIQNNYLTHTLANKNDIFLHVKSIGGSHIILKENGFNESSLQLAADIAAYYSQYRDSTNVNVDYTRVRNVKKVPKTKGSFVTYNTYNTIFANPDYQKIKERLKN